MRPLLLMNQKGFSSVFLLIGLILIFVIVWGAYYLGKWEGQKNISIDRNEMIQDNLALNKQYCWEETGCWFDTADTANGKIGFSTIRGYYHPVKGEGLTCDAFVPLDQESYFGLISSIDSKFENGDDLVSFPIDFTNISQQLTKDIKSSSKDKPLTINIVQLPITARGYTGCQPSSVAILDAYLITK